LTKFISLKNSLCSDGIILIRNNSFPWNFTNFKKEKNIVACKKIYEAYIDKKLDTTKPLNEETRSFVEKLNSDFVEIGFLVNEFDI
jgi:hypothetical protein